MRAFSAIIKICLAAAGAAAVIFLAGYLYTSGDRSVPATASDDPSVPRIALNGAVFHSEAFGDPENPVIIVVHGGPGWDYRSLLPLKALSDKFYVVFYDQRATGLSPRGDRGPITLESTLSDLDAFVDHFGKGKKVGLIGHSWGGMLVSGYIGKHPEKVARAVLAEPGFLNTEMLKASGVRFGPRWEAGFLILAARAWFESIHVKGPDAEAATDYLMGRIAPYANPEYYCGNTLPEAATTYWRPGVAAMRSIISSALDSNGELDIDLTKGVERYSEPVLFIASGCNSVIGKAHQARQARLFPNAQVRVIEGSGHMLFAERTEESLSVLREYLDPKKRPWH